MMTEWMSARGGTGTRGGQRVVATRRCPTGQGAATTHRRGRWTPPPRGPVLATAAPAEGPGTPRHTGYLPTDACRLPTETSGFLARRWAASSASRPPWRRSSTTRPTCPRRVSSLALGAGSGPALILRRW